MEEGGHQNYHSMDADKTHLVDSPESENVSSNLDEYITYLIDEIRDTYIHAENDCTARQKLEFYHIVRGGNTIIVRKVLERMDDGGFKRELEWILGTIPNKENLHKVSILRRVMNVFLYIFCVMFCTAITPIYYYFHTNVHFLYKSFKKRLIHNIDLPFVFAVLSEKKEMMQLFIEYGCDVTLKDSNMNNVFHYLADLSVDKPEKALRCHELLMSCNKAGVLQTYLMEEENYQNLTAFEAITKAGSLYYLHNLLESHLCVGHRRLEVSNQRVWSSTKQSTFDVNLFKTDLDHMENSNHDRKNSVTDDPRPSMCIWEFDMKKYEQSDVFGRQSYLLQLVTGRSVELLSRSDATAIIKSKIIGTWMQTKMKAYMIPCLLSQFLSVLISVLMLHFVILHGGNMDQKPLAHQFYEEMLKYPGSNLTNSQDATIDKIKTECNNELPELKIYENIFGIYRTADQISKDKHHHDWVKVILLLMISSNVFIDFAVRQTFLVKNFNFKANTLFRSIVPVIYRRIPGSYAEKQLSAFIFLPFFLAFYTINIRDEKEDVENKMMRSYARSLIQNEKNPENSTYSMNFSFSFHKDDLEKAQLLIEEVAALNLYTSLIFLLCLLLRFLHTIHSMRLLPGIGFFIITTKKMSRHLVQFGVVFIIVLLAFATMFYLGIRRPECPALSSPGFSSLGVSMYSTFQMTLGHGDVADYANNMIGQIAYVFCTIIVIIMLLNLIIAVMTTTATDMNNMPWREVLCKVELWDEFLGTEAQVLTLCQILSLFCFRNKICSKRCTAKCCRRCQSKTMRFTVTYFNKEGEDSQLS